MTATNSRLSYADCYSFFDEALAGKRGARHFCGYKKKALWMRLRLHQARSLDRKDNQLIYPDPSEPLHGRSVYDILSLRLRQDTGGDWWVYALKNELNLDHVERLGGDEGTIEADEVEQ